MKEQSIGKMGRIVIFKNLTKLTICQSLQFWEKKKKDLSSCSFPTGEEFEFS